MGKADIDMVLKWRNSDDVRRYMLSDVIIKPEDHLKWFQKNSNDESAELFIAEYKNSSIGVVTITEIEKKNNTCTWSMYIGEDVRNLGIGILMNILAIDRMVNYHKIRKIWGQVLGSNRIVKMHERFGFKREGVLESHIKRNGRFEDIILLGLFADQWLENRQDLTNTFKIY